LRFKCALPKFDQKVWGKSKPHCQPQQPTMSLSKFGMLVTDAVLASIRHVWSPLRTYHRIQMPWNWKKIQAVVSARLIGINGTLIRLYVGFFKFASTLS
jgi:hypothetical protein